MRIERARARAGLIATGCRFPDVPTVSPYPLAAQALRQGVRRQVAEEQGPPLVHQGRQGCALSLLSDLLRQLCSPTTAASFLPALCASRPAPPLSDGGQGSLNNELAAIKAEEERVRAVISAFSLVVAFHSSRICAGFPFFPPLRHSLTSLATTHRRRQPLPQLMQEALGLRPKTERRMETVMGEAELKQFLKRGAPEGALHCRPFFFSLLNLNPHSSSFA